MSTHEINLAFRRKYYKNIGREDTHTANGNPRKLHRGKHPELAGLKSHTAAYRTAYTRLWRAAHPKNPAGRPVVC